MTSKEKIDKLLGIENNQSIDDFLDDISLDVDKLSASFDNIQEDVQQNIKNVDSKIKEINSGSVLEINDLTMSMKEIEDMIVLSKKMFKHIYENIISSDLLDSELISAASKLLESIHINIAEFISFYKDKQRYIDRVKIMVFQQEQKKELMILKHQQDLEKLKYRNESEQIDENANNVTYSFEEVLKGISDYEKEKSE